MEKMLVCVDGAQGEGGGQIIRTAVGLSALTGRPLEIKNIRARRSKPGLQAQHLTSVRAAATLCGAQVVGAELGSQWLRFEPQAWTKQSDFRFDVGEARSGGSAGATGLVLQTVLPILSLFSTRPLRVEVIGGTHVPMSPVSDYLEGVSLPLWQEMGVTGSLSLERSGFFPRGGGSLTVELEAGTLQKGIQWEERGKLKGFWLSIVTSLLPKTVAERGSAALLNALKGYGVPIAIELRDLESNGAGAAITLVAECEQGRAGFTSLGERGKPMERVALEVYRAFLKWYESKTTVDAHLADQLVLPAALVADRSCWTTPEITEHLRTVLEVTRQFLSISSTLTPLEGGGGRVEIVGTLER